MDLDWRMIDRWLIGEAWTGSRIPEHLHVLCDDIGPRWASSRAEARAAAYVRDQMQNAGLAGAALEPFQLDTWAWTQATARVQPDDRPIDLLPFLRCPSFNLTAPLVDVGYGTPRELEQAGEVLPGAIGVMALGYAPFTPPIHLGQRLRLLTERGTAAAVVIESRSGRRLGYKTATDWREPGPDNPPLPTVLTSREDGALLCRLAREGRSLQIAVDSRLYRAPSANVAAELAGTRWPQEHLLLSAHHDTVYDSPGGNDNAAGVVAVLETARVLAHLESQAGVGPGRSIRFVTFSAEEQKLQGASAYVARHYGSPDLELPPRLGINLDELSTGHIKGIVLGFPHLRELMQAQLDTLGDGLQCQVMAQIDATGDHFPFLQAGLDGAHLWRWRFHSRHADAEYHHERGDTADKVNVRELKEYVGQLARILLRLSHVPPQDWPQNSVTPAQVQARLAAEQGSVVRVF
jgi:hypothetical protein